MKKSILNALAPAYKMKTAQNSSILDNPEEGRIELYPAGFTHLSSRDGRSRQKLFQDLWEKALFLGKETLIYPFGKDHSIALVPDPHNKYDPNAIHLILRAGHKSVLSSWNGLDMGFIPKKINEPILENIEKIHTGYILKVRDGVHHKHHVAKVVLFYGEKRKSNPGLARFMAILEEE